MSRVRLRSFILQFDRGILATLSLPVIVVVSTPLLLLILASITIAGLYTAAQFIPVATAEVFIPKLNATVTLQQFFVMGDGIARSGRYLSVVTPRGTASKELSWSSQIRTSIYLSGNDVAVLGPGDEFVVKTDTLQSLAITRTTNSGTWSYLGAFDGRSGLAFFKPNEQRECIPSLRQDSWLPRSDSREHSCKADGLSVE
ncbi:hypothetical protein [Tardiphaga sp. 839_C3_N1_4]|jgi:hypothetical protein|uniref:hypothetical protein n=1 Tax=Tardiphaga sp. 839_C3_N1_4 TaxID=3240761 RepID=UPI003F2010D1